MNQKPLISIIALNFNQPKVTVEFLESLHKLKYPNFEVIVVDNGSKENPYDAFKEAYPDANIILSPENLGFTGGNNLGMEHANGDFFFIVNNDTEVTEDLLDLLIEPFEMDQRIAMVSPKIKFYSHPDTIQYAGFRKINPFTGQNGAVGSKEIDQGQYDESGYTNYAHGAAMLVKREAVEKVGMFPDIFFIYYEELDWSSHMLKAGYKIYYQGKATIFHKESITMGKESAIKAYYHTRNRILFMRRNYSGFQFAVFFLFLVSAIIPKAFFKYLLSGKKEHMRSLFRAISWHLKKQDIYIQSKLEPKKTTRNRMTTSLVTGGAGFIGSHVARHCLNKGHKVVVLDDLSGGFEDHIPEGCEFVLGSVYDHILLEELFEKYQFDYVYHLAAYAAEGLSHFIRRFNYNNNLVGSVNLINESVKHKVKCFVFTSSIAVYGAGQLPMTEDMTPIPEDPYGVSKYAVELDLKAAHEMYGLDYVVFRPHNVYGENQNIGDKYRNVIGIFMNQIMQGKQLTIFGDGTQTRAFSYIDDVAIPIAECVDIPETYNEVFNIGADKPYSVKELAEIVCKAFDVEPDINFLKARNEVLHAYSDHAKAHKYFTSSGITLDEGISRMAKWAKAVGARKSQEFDNIEIYENLPEGWTVKKKIKCT